LLESSLSLSLHYLIFINACAAAEKALTRRDVVASRASREKAPRTQRLGVLYARLRRSAAAV